MPLINIPSKSARRGTREPELHSVKGDGGEEARETLSGQLCHRFPPRSSAAGKNRRGILHFAPAAFIPEGNAVSTLPREGSRIATSVLTILISAYSYSSTRGSSYMFKREETRRKSCARLRKSFKSERN